jgi:hypothetical protein
MSWMKDMPIWFFDHTDSNMKIKAINITYDTDGEKVQLPSSLSFDVDSDFDPEYELADLVSEETGWCVLSCDYEWIHTFERA